MRTILLAAALMVGALPAWAQQSLPPEVTYPDVILHNGKVLTMDRNDAKFTVAEAVAVRGSGILAVGTSARIMRMAGSNTRKISEVKVIMTMVNGELKFTAPEFAEATGLKVIGYQGQFAGAQPETE